MSERIFNNIREILSANGAKFRVIEHEKAGTSELVANVRKSVLAQGAKALLCTIKTSNLDEFVGSNMPTSLLLDKHLNVKSGRFHVLAVFPADHSANLSKLANALGANKASLASPAEVEILADCVFGAVPPFSFHEQLMLVVDENLFKRYDEIAFNAGLLERSIVLDVKDYERIAKPRVIKFADNVRRVGKLSVMPIGVDCTQILRMDQNEAINFICKACETGYDLFDIPSGGESLAKKAFEDSNGSVKFALNLPINLNTNEIKFKIKEVLDILGVSCVKLCFLDINSDTIEKATLMEELVKDGLVANWGVYETGFDKLKEVCEITQVSAIKALLEPNTLKELKISSLCKIDQNFINSQNLKFINLAKFYAAQKDTTKEMIILSWLTSRSTDTLPMLNDLNVIKDGFNALKIGLKFDEILSLNEAFRS
ncbi:hypothetical protein CCAL13119_06780 [Campylobacter sp. RM13119]|uniref:YbaK/EbsC family protein n=1 Tax=Campylobacter californiensis TaxID=1032243 RepID=UPI001475EB16|nr:YbaK/EbsC family protein [Campylobacter sp. RM13119]MBE3606656.1 hypothetical protein [Campylobacter sp. RM13119]